MTPPGTDNPPSKDTDLGASLDSLVSEMTGTPATAEKPVDAQPAPTNNGLEIPPAKAPVAGSSQKGLNDKDLAAVVEGLLSEAANKPKPDETSKEPDAVEAIESLDAQLAELTSQLLDQKPPDPTNAMPPLNKAPAQAVDAGRKPEPPVAMSPPPAVPEPAPAPPSQPAEPVQEAKPSVVPVAAAPAPAAPAPPTVTPPPPAPPVAAPVVAPVTQAETAALAAPIEAAPGQLLLILGAISKPLTGRPAWVRIVLGLFALSTLSLALIVWMYLLIRPPIGKEEGPHPFNLAGDTLPQPAEPPKAEAPHAEAAGGHGAKSEGHGEAAKDEHGGAKAKKPPAKTPKKPPAKKPDPKKTEGGHGGH